MSLHTYVSMVNLNERWHEALPLTGLGATGGLGAVPTNVRLVMGISSSDWDSMPPDQQAALRQQADSAINGVRNATNQAAQVAIGSARASIGHGEGSAQAAEGAVGAAQACDLPNFQAAYDESVALNAQSGQELGQAYEATRDAYDIASQFRDPTAIAIADQAAGETQNAQNSYAGTSNAMSGALTAAGDIIEKCGAAPVVPSCEPGTVATKSVAKAFAEMGVPFEAQAGGGPCEPVCGGAGQPGPCCEGLVLGDDGNCKMCGVAAEPCPCCAGFSCVDGVCETSPAGGRQKASMMWIGLLGLLAVGAYAMSQKKKRRPNRRRSAYA